MPKTNFPTVVFIFLCFSLISCDKKDDQEKAGKLKRDVYDLVEIKTSGELRALVDNSTTSYFVYKGNPMGFEYELLKRFAEALKVDLKVIPIENLDSIIPALNQNKGDLIAANFTVTKQRSQKVAFSTPLIESKQVLVQREKNQAKSSEEAVDFIESPSELIGKKVYVRKGSSFFKRLQHLSEEIGGDILIEEVAGEITVEELIKKVHEGEIDYTVADEHVAKINQSFYRNIHIRTPISLEQKVAWAVRKESTDLLIALNAWLNQFKKTTDFRVIYLKYYGNTGLYKTRVNSPFFVSRSGKLSPYDETIKAQAKRIGWDWRLLTSLIYQESQFNHQAKSWAGAFGLMQLMPNTAEEYGIDSTSKPAEQIAAGVSYLKWLDRQFEDKVPDSSERFKFILAAYNVGLGHVFDAIRLAKKHGLNEKKWENEVAEMLLKKSKPEYYNDSVVHYGYCRGSEPYRYVKEIINRYKHYQNNSENQFELEV